MKEKYDWILWVIGAGLVLALAWGCSANTPCSWYDSTPSKNVPNRCVKK